MQTVTRKLSYRFNSKKVFDGGDLQLWLNSDGGPNQPISLARFRLKRLKAGTRTRFKTVWAGTVKIDEGEVTVTTTRSSPKKP
jgi:hypothetical protein